MADKTYVLVDREMGFDKKAGDLVWIGRRRYILTKVERSSVAWFMVGGEELRPVRTYRITLRRKAFGELLTLMARVAGSWSVKDEADKR